MSAVQGYAALQARLHAMGAQGNAGVMKNLGGHVVAEAKILVHRKTGNLGRSIRVESATPTSVTVVASANYAAYVERGTGLYGPKHRRIDPGKVMRWATGGASAVRLSGSSRTSQGKALAAFAYARSTKGMKPAPFLIPGAKAAISKAGVQSVVDAWNRAA